MLTITKIHLQTARISAVKYMSKFEQTPRVIAVTVAIELGLSRWRSAKVISHIICSAYASHYAPTESWSYVEANR